jgi:O-antigen biosynthesis protein
MKLLSKIKQGYRKIYAKWRYLLTVKQADAQLQLKVKQVFESLPKANGVWEWQDYSSLKVELNQLQPSRSSNKQKSNGTRLIAFYLPQFHPIPENDRWWGKGFTEWTNVAKAKPNFLGHDQPRQPADLGFYDLRIPEVMREQIKLAKEYGVDAFCFYYYWFAGKRLLEKPLEMMLKHPDLAIPFCVCWANENWTRRWDGRNQDVLIAQDHSETDDLKVIADLATYFKSPHYLKVDGKPLLLIYRTDLFPEFSKTAERWRMFCRQEGLGEIYLAMVESAAFADQEINPSNYGCDAAVEFPPIGGTRGYAVPPSGEIINQDFSGTVIHYHQMAKYYVGKKNPAYRRFPGVMPGWDNTARRQNNGVCFEYSTPGAFQAWLEKSIEKTEEHHERDERLVFINAWNEWAEGAYLEPDRRFGHSFLEAVRKAREKA